MSVRPAKTQISLGIRPVWSESSLSAWRNIGGCPGWSESSLGAHSLCWFCHVAAHLDPESQKIIYFVKIYWFLKKQNCRFTVAWESGTIHAQTWQERCIKWSYFRSQSVAKVQHSFTGRFGAWIGLENWVGRRFDPHISLDGFLGSPGHQNSSLREAQPVYYFSMVLN